MTTAATPPNDGPGVAELPAAGVARRFLALGFGEAASRLIAFAAMVYAARVLGAGPYGTIGVAAAVILYLNRVVDGGFELGLGVREVAADPSFVSEVAPSVLWVRTLMAVILAGGATAVGLLLLPEPDGAVLAITSWGLVGVGIGSRWIHLGRQRPLVVALAAITGQAVMAVVVVAVVRAPEHLYVVPAAQVAGDLAVAGLMLAALRGSGVSLRPRIRWPVIRPLVPRSRHLVASALLGIVVYSSGLLFLRAVRDSEQAGFYAAAYSLVTFFLNVGAMYSLSLLSSLTRLAADPDRQRDLYHAAFAHVFAIGFPVAVGGALLAGPAIEAMFGSGFAAAAVPFAWLIWSIPVNLLRDVSLMALMSRGKESLVFRITWVSALVSVALALVLVPPFGLAGAAVATIVTEVFRAGMAATMARIQGFPFPSPRRFAKAGLAGLGMAAVLLVASPAGPWAAVPLGMLGYGMGLILVGGLRLRGLGLPELRV